MKRTLITISFIIFSIPMMYSQRIAYYDAIKIKSVMDTGNGKFNSSSEGLKPIFDFYFGSEQDKAIQANSFLNHYFEIIQKSDSTIQKSNFTNQIKTVNLSDLFDVIPSSVRTLDIATKAIDYGVKFIVKRAKEELSMAFFDKFKDDLKKQKDLQDVFPQTYRTLSVIGEEIYTYGIYLETLRESFKKDLAALPTNLPHFIENHNLYFNQRQDLKAELLTAFYIAQAVQNKQHPGEVIENYPIEDLNSIRPNVKAAFQTLKLFSKSLKSNNDTTYWVSSAEIKSLTKYDTLLNIYLGLVLQLAKEDSIQFDNNGTPFNLADRMNKTYTNLQPYKTFIGNLGTKTQSLETKIQKIKKTDNDSLTYEKYYGVVCSSIDLMRYVAQIDQLAIFKNDSLDLTKKTAPYFDFAQTASDMVIDINRKYYATAIVSASQLVYPIIDKTKNQQNNLGNELVKIKPKYEIAKNNYSAFKYIDSLCLDTNIDSNTLLNKIKQNKKNSTALSDTIHKKVQIVNTLDIPTIISNELTKNQPYLDSLRNSIKCSNKRDSILYNSINTELNWKNEDTLLLADIAKKLQKYGSFMAAVENAKNSDEVEAAIEAVVLPSGSYRIKRESALNISLNAYCGLYGGIQQGTDNLFKFNSFGITAPIGVSFSGGHLWPFNSKDGWSSSIFVSIIDLGAVAAYRFSNSTDSVPTIKLADIISPGVFISIGIAKCPVSINAGCQMTPLLTTVSTSKNTFGTKSLRFTIGACIDLPLLNLYNKPR